MTKEELLDSALSDYFEKSGNAIKAIADNLGTIKRMAVGICESQLAGGKLLIGGNGGSCADADHFAGEMTCTFADRRRRGFSAVSLTNNAAAITAWTNDFGFNTYFVRQVEALGRPGDILFLITTGGGERDSGASMNLVAAAEKAMSMGIKVYAIAGKTGGELSKMAHEFIKVPSSITSHIQEAHIACIHAICLALDVLDRHSREIFIRNSENVL
jgi:D-sedoheptulose 7-phosphate isomerase